MTTPAGLPVGATAIADRATGNELKPNSDGSINIGSGGGGGTQYTDGGATPTHPIGSIPVFDNSGTITAVGVAHPLPVTGGGGGTEYTDGVAPPTNPIGKALLYDNSGAWVDVGVDHPLPVNSFLTGGTAITKRAATTVLNLASSPRASYSSGALAVGAYTDLALDINVTLITGGTAPTVTFKLTRIGADGVLYQLYLPSAQSATPVSFSTSIGAGLLVNSSFGSQVQLDMIVTGAPTSVTFSASLIGK
jgi:hypothetical protein